MYVGSYNNSLYAIQSTGFLSWSYATGSGGMFSSPAIGSDGRVYVGSWDDNLYAIQSTGSLSWSYTAGSYVSSSPAIGSDGRVYVGSRDNSLYAFEQASIATPRALTPTPTATPTAPTPTAPTPTPTATPTDPTPTPALEIIPSDLQAGRNLSFTIKLHQDINQAFDYYIFADSPFGPYTLYINGMVEAGITALYTNVPGYKAPFEMTVIPNVILPLTMGEKEVTFYTVVVEAGQMPPVQSPSTLTTRTENVILMDKESKIVAL